MADGPSARVTVGVNERTTIREQCEHTQCMHEGAYGRVHNHDIHKRATRACIRVVRVGHRLGVARHGAEALAKAPHGHHGERQCAHAERDGTHGAEEACPS